MLQFIRTIIRLLTGRIAFERRASLLVADMLAREGYCAHDIHAYLMRGEIPR